MIGMSALQALIFYYFKNSRHNDGYYILQPNKGGPHHGKRCNNPYRQQEI